jgi:sucrose phosphorylase
MAGVPGVYFHSLFGSRNDRAAADASGIPRRINRQKLERAALQHELSDGVSIGSQIFAAYGELLNLRRHCPAFHPLGGQEVLQFDPRVFALQRASPDGRTRMLCLHNVSNQQVGPIKHPSISGRRWTRARPGSKGSPRDGALMLQPFEVLWILGEDKTSVTTTGDW